MSNNKQNFIWEADLRSDKVIRIPQDIIERAGLKNKARILVKIEQILFEGKD